ncbi:DUF1330 domain-containing protein [Pseudozobellia thermophila]|uniref:DUF1330 domain-containing protein n=1 Tax=Pseudozobellia thermophila TaxID=192903 RepID=A0A1M6EUS2_9FLAO|nr:DUF1330 domain-containing protein [Pseudozobellia thermophila]SHI89217.1 protein of unknown function [Pseudozobellia thermophila]
MNYLDPTPEAGREFYQEFKGKGRLVMLNLVRFKRTADYSHAPHLKKSGAKSGRAAYEEYIAAIRPVLEAADGKVLFYGECGAFVVGPEAEKWDRALLVEHASVDTFMKLAQSPVYLENLGHRTAALEDFRLLPMTSITGGNF